MAVKYDMYFQPVPAGQVSGFKCFEFGYAAVLKVSGFPSLIDRWVKTFMTPLGSDILYPEYGTAFGNLPGSNISRVTGDLLDVTNIAIAAANEQVMAQDIVGLYPLDEQLQSVELIDFKESADGLEVWVHIKNKAGDSMAVKAASLG